MKSVKKIPVRAKTTAALSRAAKPAGLELSKPTRREIAMRAYEIYAHSGHPPGREVEFWLEAERQLQREPKK